MKTILAAACVVLGSFVAVGCAGSDSTSSAAPEVVASPDLALKNQIAAAIAGLETGGGRADPTPYKVLMVDLAADQPMTEDFLIDKVLMEILPNADQIPGVEESPAAEEWARNTADPNPSRFRDDAAVQHAREMVAKWKNVKGLFDTKLHEVKYFDMGYRSFEGGSLETGEVCHVFLGRSETGKVFAIWGIDVWT